jgi:energy-coupling factor transporter ATP-binding protein EcfA2
MVLERKELAIKASHSDAVQVWLTGGQIGLCPPRELPPLERLFELFHEIFPRMQIHYDPNAKSITVSKGSAQYSIASMSDGEKQAFSILADFVELGDEYGLVVVDEPELNLHSELAERVWALIESQYPDKMYLYATHSLSFAMRAQVERVIVLSDNPEHIAVIDDPTNFSAIHLREFLGSIPGILAADRVVVTEGTDKSFDSVFYRWLVGSDQIEVMPAGDCEQVLSVCRRNGIWAKLAPTVRLSGVIDADLRSGSPDGVAMLAFREAESYLAIPSLIVKADAHLAIAEERLTAERVVALCLENVLQERQLICANRVAARCGIRLGVSVKRAVLRECASTQALLAKLKDSSQEELAKAAAALGDATIEAIVVETEKEVDRVVAERDWKTALALIDGKKVANQLAVLVGVKSAIDLMRSIAANVRVDEVPEVQALSERLRSPLTTPAAQLGH